MNSRSKILFALWFLLVIATILFFARFDALGQPISTVPTNRFSLNVYFSATALDSIGQESDYSSEIYLPITNRHNSLVTLAWDAVPGLTGLTYRVYRGNRSRTYATNFSAGTNLCITIPIFAPPLTNCVITITSMNATDILWASSLAFIGPWQRIGRTNWSATNPAPRVFRAIGKKGSKPLTSITNRLQ